MSVFQLSRVCLHTFHKYRTELRGLFAHAGKISHSVIYKRHKHTLVWNVEGCAAVMAQYLHAWQRAGKFDVEEAVHQLISARHTA